MTDNQQGMTRERKSLTLKYEARWRRHAADWNKETCRCIFYGDEVQQLFELIDRLRAENEERGTENAMLSARESTVEERARELTQELRAENAELKRGWGKEKARLKYAMTYRGEDRPSAFIELQMRILEEDYPTIEEWIAVIDDGLSRAGYKGEIEP